MFCKNCGKELAPGAIFCAECGTMVEQSYEETPSFYQVPTTEQQKKKNGKKIALAIGGIAAAAAIAVGGFFLFRKLAPKTPEKSVDQTLEAYSQAADTVFGADLSKEVEALEKYSMDLEVKLTGGSELPGELRGAGFTYEQDVDMKGREIGASLGASYSGLTLAEAQLLIEDNELYVGMEELLGEGLYGVNTETIGEDLAALGIDDGDGLVESISFNLFDLADRVNEVAEPSSEDAWADVWEMFADAVESEKQGEETIDVNGYDVKCTKYCTTIKEEVLEDLADDMIELVAAVDYALLAEVICEELGLPAELAEELLAEMNLEEFDTSYYTEEMEEAIAMIGDISLDIYVKDGKIMAVIFDEEFDGVAIEAGLYLGGGKNYVDDWSLIIEVEEDGEAETVKLTSGGNHAGKGGEFTDETKMVYIDYEGEETVLFTSEMAFAYKEDSDNFSWVLNVPEEETVVTVEGTVNNGKGQIYVDLDNISVEVDEESIVEIALMFRLGEYERRVDGDKQLISEMSMKDLMSWATKVAKNAEKLENKLEDLGIEF